MTDATIHPFRIDVPESTLADLSRRLENTRYPAALPGDSWDTGVPVSYLKQLTAYWAHSYNWSAQQTLLNSYPQFTTKIDEQTIHFLHIRSSHQDALPLLLTHGWPGSFVEFLDVIGPLTDPASHGLNTEDAFHLVIPSLPGFGFSNPVTTTGWDVAHIGSAWAELMDRLGYDKYGVQGGDIGADVSPEVARAAPEHVVGVHVNGALVLPTEPPDEAELASFTDIERDRLRRIAEFMDREFGYISIQSTRPQTVGAGLADSPPASSRGSSTSSAPGPFRPKRCPRRSSATTGC
ncbi:epoxide hydrolase [Williamsia sp. 1135]|uniref:epoxide hydrolase family protein n=1 Tax=Williamsia sp. 1135 TaxID=1889262 RepID=UPI001F0A3200|nr:epoxide hydrolase [Williamsia sp. 1135]